jgi:hypothetical protein
VATIDEKSAHSASVGSWVKNVHPSSWEHATAHASGGLALAFISAIVAFDG